MSAKSERLFNHARYAAASAIDYYGVGKIDALSTLNDGTDECIYARTLNDIQKHLDSFKHSVEINNRYGIKNIANAEEIIRVVQNTINNYREVF